MDKLGLHFIEQTKYHNLTGESDQGKGLPQPPLELAFREDNLVELPSPEMLESGINDLQACLESRRSLRSYAKKPLTLEELSYLLWYTQGVKKEVPGKATLRFVPSAGARHAFETYILANQVDEIESGLYRYIATRHQLLPFNLEHDIADKVTQACLYQSFVKTSAVTFIWVAVPYRMTYRYQERGYRYLYLDAGHVCQNLYLTAESIQSGACAIAAYNDDEMNSLLNLDGESQFVIYVATVGKK